MEVRCGSCNKLFRIADEKITGSGIKFACSQCGSPVKVTREEFEQHVGSKTAEPVLPPAAGQPRKMEVRCSSCSKLFRISEDKITGSGVKFACSKCGAPVTISKEDLENYMRTLEKAGPLVSSSADSQPPLAAASLAAPAAEPAAAVHPVKSREDAKDRQPPVAVAPAPGEAEQSKPAPTKPAPSLTETSPSASLLSEQAKLPVKQESEQASAVLPATAVSASGTAAPSSTLRQLMVLAVAVIVMTLGYMAISRFKASAPVTAAPVSTLTSIDGLHVRNTSAVYDPKGDYVISGDIVNTSEGERPAWLVVAEVFDANGALLGKARLLNGIELYTQRDYGILAKRGIDVQALKALNLQEPRSKLLPYGTVHFEIAIIEAPAAIEKFSASLQPFDPLQLFNEVSAEQKQP